MIIPVLDLKNGEAVSGKSGMRDSYSSLKTVFSSSSNPIKIAESLKKEGYKEIYIADLDSIDGHGSNFSIVCEVNDIIPVMLDPGINNVDDVKDVLNTAEKIIIATETINNLDELDLIFSKFSEHSLILSVDVKDNNILSKNVKINFEDITQKIEQIKPSETIILDISGVGTSRGFDQDLIKRFNKFNTELIIGGGVTKKNMYELKRMGVHKFLVGTALHTGKFDF